jgi:RNA polymerase sigma-70 factor, ECF subfamily
MKLASRSTSAAETRIERARRGERDAVAEIYTYFAPRVAGYLRGGGARDPEDLAGDVFVSVIRGLAAFDGDEEAFRRWVFTIAHHRLVDSFRREAVRAVEVGPGSGGATDGTEYDRVLDRIDAAPAVRALRDLTAEQRDVVLLRSVVGLSVADTAVVLGKSAGAVKTLHRRALAALNRLLDQEMAS